MQKNKSAPVTPAPRTHEGAVAARINAEQQLRRSVMACLLWEKTFYEEGEDIAKRIASLVPLVEGKKVAKIAIEAREEMKLRHAPLFLVREMARHRTHTPYVADTLARVVQRGDELAEFLSLYWLDGKQLIAHSVRDGLNNAIRKFNEYELAKYDRDKAVRLRDVFRMIRPKPDNAEQSALWKRAVTGELKTPDTWEVALSAKDDKSKKEKWERLLAENKLGALAILRNLRNMEQEKVDDKSIRKAILGANVRRVLPFRFIAAARFAPRFEPELEQKMFESVTAQKLEGKTAILVDVSASMNAALSAKSDMKRLDAAYGVAMVGRELFSDVDIYSFSNHSKLVAPRHGFALRDAIDSSQGHNGTNIGDAVLAVSAKSNYQRLIVITDEQSSDTLSYPSGVSKAYMINVASYQNGVGYGAWTHIDGFSEAVFNYILTTELPVNTPKSVVGDDDWEIIE